MAGGGCRGCRLRLRGLRGPVVAGIAGPRLVAAGQLAIAARPRGPGAGAGRLAAGGGEGWATGGWRWRLLVAGAAVGGSGGSELTKNGSHLVAAVFSDKPRRSYDGGPQRAVQNQASCCTGRPRRTVLYRKRPRSVREAHLSAGDARGGGSKSRCGGQSRRMGWWQISV